MSGDQAGWLQVHALGDTALLLEPADAAAVHALADAVRALDEVVDVVPGARTVVLHARRAAAVPALRAQLERLSLPRGRASGRTGDVVELPTVYDGPDLAEVARLTGLSVAEVVAAHTGSLWRVGFGGFAPGFAYLVDGDPRLQVPRRDEPRERVPAGSVGLAGEHSGVYPRSSPGGWQLVGRTDAVLWDVDRDPPALLHPGAQVRFVAVDAR